MEFFGLTLYGPQNYIKDTLNEGYEEPLKKEDVEPLLKRIKDTSTLPTKIERPDITIIRQIDCYIGRVNGFAYGSIITFNKMKRKGVMKPVGPCDIHRIPAVSSMEYGWWQHDPTVLTNNWHKTCPRFPQPSSPDTRILDIVRKNNKYATLF